MFLKENAVNKYNIDMLIEKSKVIRDKDACDFNILIEKAKALNKKSNSNLDNRREDKMLMFNYRRG